MIFDEHSNAACRLSLGGPGAELEAGPARVAQSTGPARVNNLERLKFPIESSNGHQSTNGLGGLPENAVNLESTYHVINNYFINRGTFSVQIMQILCSCCSP